MKKVLLSLFMCSAISSFSQEIENLVKAAGDANKIANAYSAPALEGLIYSMNNGWFHTAKVHKKFGFDITIGASGSFVPSERETYQISALGLTSTIISSPETAPTIFGEGDGGTLTLQTTVSGIDVGNGTTVDNVTVDVPLELPEGFKEDLPGSLVPAPAVQVTVGLPWKLETSVRFVPKVGSDDVKGSLFGIGLKKEITDILGPLDKLPLHLAVMGTYTNMNVDGQIEDSTEANFIVRNAETQFRLNSYTIQLLASLNFPIINFYGAVGYGGGNATVDVLGDYSVIYDVSGSTQRVRADFKDPIKQEFSAGSMRATIGTRLSLGFFKIFADYTLQEYNTVSAGIAFSFR
ncbi:DUF6588 family protein [Tenacibaculum sp. ZS6-P6]|uniref:DUF6588 family protein n=1 Tax=Tenacibaculum sp. ZS6-P6 TaxID=3447503 RepID=UPI003F945C0B